jgi:hypothetical protein
MEEDFFYHELKELVLCMKWESLEVLLPLLYFLHAFDRKKGHDMLALIFDLRFKNIWLVTAFLGCENVTIVDYNQELILPLLIKTNKMLMHAQSQCC